MNLKRLTILGIAFIFGFSFITHNLYEWFPNAVTAIFFPVNESVWEHQKMIYTTTIIWGLINHFLINKYNIKIKNKISAIYIGAIANVIIFLLVYTPIYLIWGHNLILTLLIYLITIIIAQIIAYIIFNFKQNLKTLNYYSLVLIPLTFLIFWLLTYYPIELEYPFYDTHNDKHGIYSYY
ncbi:MAG: DUF6512 family protein [Bacilli bacterium]|nr:DUF6512 family protein [Bacilli bacterium]